MPFRSEKQRRYLLKNKPDMAKKWTDEHGSTPVKAKKGKYQEFKHPQHNITPIEHMEENVSSKERVEKLLDERKTKKETKKKLVKQGPAYVPGWRPNLSVKAKESKYITKKTALKGHADSIKEIYKVAKENRKYGQEDRLTRWDLENAIKIIKSRKSAKRDAMLAETDPGVPYKTGGPIKAKESKYIQKKKWWHSDKLKSTVSKLKEDIQFIKDAKAGKLSPSLTEKAKKKILNQSIGEREDTKTKRDLLHDKEAKGGQSFTPGWKPQLSVRTAKEGKVIKAKKGLWSGAATDMYHKPPGWEASKISTKTHKKLTKLWKHREAGGWKEAKGYKKHLKALGKMQKAPLAGMSTTLPPKTARLLTNLKFAYKQTPKAKALSVLKKLGKRTGIGKALLAATAVAGAYEAGKHKLFSLERPSKEKILKEVKKKKVTKKSIGGETVVMKSGGGYIDDLL